MSNRNNIRELLITRRARITPELTLNYDALENPADPGLTIVACAAEPGSPAGQALNLLAEWAAAQDALAPGPACSGK